MEPCEKYISRLSRERRAKEEAEELLERRSFELYKANERLAQSEQKFRNLIENSSDWVWATDINGVYTYASPQVEKLLGYKPDEIVGKSCFELMETLEIDSIKEKFGEIVRQKGSINALLNVNIHKDGRKVYVETSAMPIITQEGNLVGYNGIDRDVSDRVEKEKKLKIQEQMLISQSRQAAMGEMIGMIAHQWRQPITTIGMAINNIKIDIELGTINMDGLDASLDDISDLVQHLSKTIDDFRDFFRDDKQKELTTIDSAIEDTIHIIGKSIEGNNIELHVQLAAEAETMIFKREMMQALLNILKNAKDILLERAIKTPCINISSEQNEHEVLVTISDNAGGIPKAILPHIFEPYFTTKGPAAGTGLGLYMSDVIVREHHGGRIEASNSKDGACFVVRIPVVARC